MSERKALFDARRIAEIRQLVTRWISEPEPGVLVDLGAHAYTIPASPDDVIWLCDLAESLQREADQLPCFCGTKDAYRCPVHVFAWLDRSKRA